MPPSDAELCSAVWTWLHPDNPVVDSGHFVGDRDCPMNAPNLEYVPDYLHDEDASAELWEALAAKWSEVTQSKTMADDWEIVLQDWETGDEVRVEDPDRKRAIVLSAYKALLNDADWKKAEDGN